MVETLLALDPGTTTGYCVYEQGSFVFGQIGPEMHHKPLWALMKGTEPTTIICEDFTFRPNPNRRKVVLDSKEYIGVVKLYGSAYDVPVKMQMASQAKGFWGEDNRIRKLGLWQPGQRHAMDALRHMLYYLSFDLNDNRFLLQLK